MATSAASRPTNLLAPRGLFAYVWSAAPGLDLIPAFLVPVILLSLGLGLTEPPPAIWILFVFAAVVLGCYWVVNLVLLARLKGKSVAAFADGFPARQWGLLVNIAVQGLVMSGVVGVISVGSGSGWFNTPAWIDVLFVVILGALSAIRCAQMFRPLHALVGNRIY